MRELPEGWAEVSLEQLFEFKYGKALPERDRQPGDFPVFGSGGKVGSHQTAITKSPALIIGRKGSVGMVHASHKPCWPIDTTYYVDTFVAGLDPVFWFHQLRYLRLGQQDKSSAIPGISRDDIYRSQAIVPPSDEQHRIVAKLDALLTRVSACRQRLDKIPKLLARFRQSVLAAACSGRLTEDWRAIDVENEWEEITLADVTLGKPKNGYSPNPVKHETSFKVLTLTATTSGSFDPAQYKFFDGDQFRCNQFWLQPDDILVQRGNTIEYVGVSALYDGAPDQFIFPDLMMRVRANPTILPKYLYLSLSSPRTRKFLRERATGTAGSMPKINQPTLMAAPVSLPPLAEQQEIVRRVDQLFAFADRLEGRVETARKRVEALTQSILAKAFRGELVPTEAELARAEGRAYESAAQLLERIAGVNAISTEKPKRKLRKQRSTA